MTVNINLLQSKKDYTKIELLFRLFRGAVTIFGIVIVVALSVLYLLSRNVRLSLIDEQKQRDTFVAELNKLQDREVAIQVFGAKMRQIQQITRHSDIFYRNYNTIRKHVPLASGSGSLQIVKFNQQNNVEMQVTFSDVVELSAFLAKIESDEFKKDFAYVKMGNISVSDSNKNEFALNLNVTFAE